MRLASARGVNARAVSEHVMALMLALLEEDAGITMALTLTHRALIHERKARMRRNGDRPHGGIHEAAIEEIAREQGLSVAALKWRLRQYKER